MELIDTHCHLTLFDKDALSSIFSNACDCSVTRMVCVGASDGIDSAHTAVELANSYDNIWASVGVHPHDAGEFVRVSGIEKLVEESRVVAIGETGLDFFRDWAPKDAQVKLFRNTIALARDCHKPLIIHCRDAKKETFSILKEEKAWKTGGVFHCYAEDAEFAKKLLDMNFKVSFTGNITFKKAESLREVVRAVPLNQIMLETDTPYMAPEPFRGKPSEPMHVYQVALKIAEVKGLELEEVAQTTTNNAMEFFELKS